MVKINRASSLIMLNVYYNRSMLQSCHRNSIQKIMHIIVHFYFHLISWFHPYTWKCRMSFQLDESSQHITSSNHPIFFSQIHTSFENCGQLFTIINLWNFIIISIVWKFIEGKRYTHTNVLICCVQKKSLNILLRDCDLDHLH